MDVQLAAALERCQEYQQLMEAATAQAEKTSILELAKALAAELVGAARSLTRVTAQDIVEYTGAGYVDKLRSMAPQFSAFVSDILDQTLTGRRRVGRLPEEKNHTTVELFCAGG